MHSFPSFRQIDETKFPVMPTNQTSHQPMKLTINALYSSPRVIPGTSEAHRAGRQTFHTKKFSTKAKDNT